MVAHPAVRRVNFTGSTKVGKIIAMTCAKYLKPAVLELGGKAASARTPARFHAYVQDPQFPRVGARSALSRGRMEFGTYRALGDQASAQELCTDLSAFSANYGTPGAEPGDVYRHVRQTGGR